MAKASRIPGSPGVPDTSSTRGAATSPINAHAVAEKLIPPAFTPPMGVSYTQRGQPRKSALPAEAA